MGYCFSEGIFGPYKANGWRIAYIDNGHVYLISGGAPECMCTNSDGTYQNTTCSSYIKSRDDILSLHVPNMNEVALKYCNSNYTADGKCDGTTVWAMGDSDYKKIIGRTLTQCYSYSASYGCGYQNSIYDINGNYWFSNQATEDYNAYCYQSGVIGNTYSSYPYGIRPIIKLDTTVGITGGEGTYTSPYQISN